MPPPLTTSNIMPNEEEDLKEFDEQRQKVNQARADTQAERKKIQQRRQEIEQRRQSLSNSSNDTALKELLDLQHEIVSLQEHIVELQLASDEQREFFADLKHRANGVTWRIILKVFWRIKLEFLANYLGISSLAARILITEVLPIRSFRAIAALVIPSA